MLTVFAILVGCLAIYLAIAWAVTSTLRLTGNVGATGANEALDLSSEGGITQDISIAAAFIGTLTTRTDDDTGVVTVPASPAHDIVGTDLVTLFFSGGHRRDAVVDSVTATTITFGTVTVGDGDNLPAQDAVITIQTQTVVDVDFVGNDVEALFVKCGSARMVVGFMASGTRELNVEFSATKALYYFWRTGDPIATVNPLAGHTVDEVRVAHDGAAAKTFTMQVNYNSVP